MLACHWNAAHDVPRALGASVAAGPGLQARVRLQRGPAPLRARAGAVGPRARRRGARGLRPRRRAAPRRGGRRPRRRDRALGRAGAQGDRRGRRGRPTRCAPRSCSSGSATTCAGRARPRRASRAYERAMALLPRGRERAARAAARAPRARADAARALRGGRRGRRRRRSRWPSAATTPSIQVRALNTLGLARAALGDARGRHRHAAPLARPRAARAGRRPSYVQAITNLSEVLDLAGRTEEALAEVGPAWRCCARTPSARRYDTFLELQGVNLLIRLGRLARARAGPAGGRSSATTSAPRRSSCTELRARMALLTGDAAAARAPSSTSCGACASARSTRSGWSRCTALTRAARAARGAPGRRARAPIAPRAGRARRRPRTARGSCGCAWIGLMAEATAAERARALGEPPSTARRRAAAGRRSRRPSACPASGPRARSTRRSRRAEAARLRVALGAGAPDPARLGGGRRRRSPRSSSRGRPPTPASAPPRRTCRPATAPRPRRRCARRASARRAMGAAPLLGEIDALARRARLAIAARRGRAPSAGEADESPGRRSSASPRASSRCCCSSPPGARTARSAPSCS